MTARYRSYPPNFAKAFRIPLYGIVTFEKTYTQEALQQAREQLLACGLEKIDWTLDLDKEDLSQIEQYF